MDTQAAKEHFFPHFVLSLNSSYGKIQGQNVLSMQFIEGTVESWEF